MEQQLNNSTMFVAHKKGQVHDYDDLVISSFSSSSSSASSFSGVSSDSSDSFEEVTSLISSSSSSPNQLDMSSLFQHLPIKRGLSKFYQGMSQSFTSLASVRSIEDLAKPEHPYNKRLKSCRSYGGELAKCQNAKGTFSTISRHGSKKGLHSRGSCTSKNARRGSGNNLKGSGAPVPPPRSTSTTTIPDQKTLFA